MRALTGAVYDGPPPLPLAHAVQWAMQSIYSPSCQHRSRRQAETELRGRHNHVRSQG